MATDDRLIRLYNHKILSADQLRDDLLYHLRGQGESVVQSIYRLAGSFDTAITVVADGTKVDIGAGSGTDGQGHLFEIGAADARFQNIQIPEEAGDPEYHVGLHYELVEDGVETNPRTGEITYSSLKEQIGYSAVPDAVALINGDTQLKITVDSLFLEAGHNHTGRKVRVWLKPAEDGGPGPKSAVAATAIVEGTVAYGSGSNYVEIGLLGQSTPSTTAADYKIMLVGPRVTRAAVAGGDLTAETDTLFLASVTAKEALGTVVVSTAAQPIILNALSLLGDITEQVSGHMKVAVDVQAGEAEQRQISVLNGGSPVFAVDEDGDVACNDLECNNLTVNGTEQVDINEVVLGDVQIGDDPGDTLTIHSNEIHMPASHITLGDGTENTPNNKIAWNAAGGKSDLEIIPLDNPSTADTNDLHIRRNDAIAQASKVIVKNAGAGGQVGLEVQGPVDVGNGADANSQLNMKSSTADWNVKNTAGVLSVETNQAADTTVILTNGGAGGANLSVEKDISAGGGMKMTGATALLEATTAAVPLAFNDALGSAIPLRSTADPALLTVKQNLVGAINEGRSGLADHRQNGVFVPAAASGMVVSNGGGLTANISSGAAWVNGRYVTTTGTSVAAQNGTGYVYITNAGAFAYHQTKANAFAMDTLVLAKVVAAAGNITSVTDLRIGAPRAHQKDVITVGENAAAGNSHCDFTTLATALNWISEIQDQLATTRRPETEIVIVGNVTLNNQVTIGANHTGLRIRAPRFGRSKLVIGANDVIRLDTTSDITFEDITFEVTTAGLVNLISVAGAAVSRVTFKNCRFQVSGAGTVRSWLYVPSGSTTVITEWLVKDCRFSGPVSATSSFIHLFPAATSSQVVIDNCTFDTALGVSTAIYLVDFDTISGLVFRGNTIRLAPSVLRAGTAAKYCRFENNTVLQAGYGSAVLPLFDIAGSYHQWGGQVIAVVGASALDRHAACIWKASYSVVANSVLGYGSDGSAVYGIEFTSAADNNVITGSVYHLSPAGGGGQGIILDAGADNNVVQLNAIYSAIVNNGTGNLVGAVTTANPGNNKIIT